MYVGIYGRVEQTISYILAYWSTCGLFPRFQSRDNESLSAPRKSGSKHAEDGTQQYSILQSCCDVTLTAWAQPYLGAWRAVLMVRNEPPNHLRQLKNLHATLEVCTESDRYRLSRTFP